MTSRETLSDKASAREHVPRCIIIAGPNGAGKTTAAHALVTEANGIQRIVNPDPIAMGIAGVAELAALAAGKLAILTQYRYVAGGVDFAIETTLSGRRWSGFLDKLEGAGYLVFLYYLWMPDPALCVARVRARVMAGGHGVPPTDILRRYYGGLDNLQRVFLQRVNQWHVLNADGGMELRPVASGGRDKETEIFDPERWHRLSVQAENAKSAD